MTTSDGARHLARAVTSTAPSARSGPARPGVRFHTVSGKPARAKLAAMAAPIVPSPTNPTFSVGPSVTSVSVLTTLLSGARRNSFAKYGRLFRLGHGRSRAGSEPGSASSKVASSRRSTTRRHSSCSGPDRSSRARTRRVTRRGAPGSWRRFSNNGASTALSSKSRRDGRTSTRPSVTAARRWCCAGTSTPCLQVTAGRRDPFSASRRATGASMAAAPAT